MCPVEKGHQPRNLQAWGGQAREKALGGRLGRSYQVCPIREAPLLPGLLAWAVERGAPSTVAKAFLGILEFSDTARCEISENVEVMEKHSHQEHHSNLGPD